MMHRDDSKRLKLQRAISRIKEHRHVFHSAQKDSFRKRFASVRQRIRTRVLDEFRLHEWPRFQMLDELFDKNLGLPVPTLSVCGSGTAEIRFTKLLAYFFDSRNQHGLGGLLSRAVFEDIIDNGKELRFDLCTAESEVSLGSGQLSDGQTIDNSLDILLKVGTHKILIEQKICSAEGKEQLARYSRAMRKKFGKDPMHCFYLTPDGRDGKENEWTPLSHSVLFCRIASVLDRHALSSAANHNLRALLWDLVLGPLAQKPGWMDELKKHTDRVAKDYHAYIDLKKWFTEYRMGSDEIRTLAKIIGG